MNWEPSHDEQLRTMWGAGNSAKEISIAMACGFTRNAIIGRIFRLGLSDRSRRTQQAARQQSGRADADRRLTQVVRMVARKQHKPKPKETVRNVSVSTAQQQARTTVAVALGRAEPVFTPTQFTVRESSAVFLGLKLLDLGRNDCRFPRGGDDDGTPILFCGQRQQEGSSYCPDCSRIAFHQPSTPEQIARAARARAANRKYVRGEGDAA